MNVAAVVVFTPGCPDPGPCLETLLPQADEIVLDRKPAGRPPRFPPAFEFSGTEDRLGFGANINRGIASTTAEFVAVSNPDTLRRPDAIGILAEFARSHPRCGIAGPQMFYRTGRGSQPAGGSPRSRERSSAARLSDRSSRRWNTSGPTTTWTSGRPSPWRPTGSWAPFSSSAAR